MYSKCPEHTSKLCELHCEQSDIPICVQCVFSKTHEAHDAVDFFWKERKLPWIKRPILKEAPTN